MTRVGEHVPAELAQWSGGLAGLDVGAPGKVGELELGFAVRGGRTELVHRYQRSPQQVMRPLYADPARPDVPITYLMSTGGGLVQGDRWRTAIEVGPDAHALVTTQAATRVHSMRHDYAATSTRARVRAGGVLEYMPDPLIPHAGARLHQQVRIDCEPGASVLWADTVVSGRHARGEHQAYDWFSSTLEATVDGRLVAADSLRLDPGVAGGPLVWGTHRVMGTLFVVAPGAERLLAAFAALDAPAVRAAPSSLAHGAGVWLRLFGHDREPVTDTLRAAWRIARQGLWNLDPPDLRKM